jgi:zinc and cadmium transporter
MTIATLFSAGGGSRGRAFLVSALFALLVPVGAALFLAGATASGDAASLVPLALAFSAGTFLCIAAADILPEVQFHRHDRVALSLALLLGLGMALAIGRLEAATHGAHDHGAHDHSGHDHAGHDHAGHAH